MLLPVCHQVTMKLSTCHGMFNLTQRMLFPIWHPQWMSASTFKSNALFFSNKEFIKKISNSKKKLIQNLFWNCFSSLEKNGTLKRRQSFEQKFCFIVLIWVPLRAFSRVLRVVIEIKNSWYWDHWDTYNPYFSVITDFDYLFATKPFINVVITSLYGV